MNCPIKMTAAHCPSCYFQRDGVCKHAEIIRQQHKLARKIENGYMENAERRD
jgi:hypothetical protein